MSDDVTAYIEAGLEALVRASENESWFAGHYGAALISGAELAQSSALPQAARRALWATLDRLMAEHPQWFAGVAPGDAGGVAPGDAASVAPLLECLERNAGDLRHSGHPTIYVVTGLRALSRVPHRVVSRTIEGLLHLHELASDDDFGRYAGISDYREVEVTEGDGIAEYDSIADAVRQAFRECESLTFDQTIDGKRYFLLGEKIHGVTHAHALLWLERMGYPRLARRGLAAHRLQMKVTRVPESLDMPLPEPLWLAPTDAAFWDHDGADVWHKIKLAEAATNVLPLLSPAERQHAQARLAQIWAMFGIAG